MYANYDGCSPDGAAINADRICLRRWNLRISDFEGLSLAFVKVIEFVANKDVHREEPFLAAIDSVIDDNSSDELGLGKFEIDPLRSWLLLGEMKPDNIRSC